MNHATKLLEKISDPTQDKLLVAAPMAGISNRPWRRFMRRHGSEWAISELVSANGLVHGGERTMALLAMSDDERPCAIQIFGEDIQSMIKAAKIVEQKGADLVDVNFGCPVPKVVKRGAGAGWLKRDLSEFAKLLTALVESISIPVSIKIRTGWDSNSRNSLEVCNIAYNCGISFVAIHGRTRTQGYSGNADWDYLDEIARSTKIPVIGNGDILTRSDLYKRNVMFSGRGLMVGRGVLHDPSLIDPNPQRCFFKLFSEYAALVQEDFNDAFSLSLLKKMSAWITSGMANGNHFRRNIFKMKSIPDLMRFCEDFLCNKNSQDRVDQANLLMGGHG